MGKIYGRRNNNSSLNDKNNEITQNDTTSKFSIDSNSTKDNFNNLNCSSILLSKEKNNCKYDQTFQYGIKRLAVLMFGFVFIFYCWASWFKGFDLKAEGKTGYAYVNTNSTALAVRSNAGTEYMLLDRLPKNSQIFVLDSALDSKGATWYQIEYLRGQNQLRTGYVHSSYVIFYEDIASKDTDPEFEKFMDEQKFPESYKPYLRILHKNHPSWVFNAQHIDLDWATALKEESKVGINMISKSYAYSYRSMEPGAYDWDTNEWIYLDTGCYGASETIIAHYLDPRNSLANDTAVFQFEDLSYIPELQNADNTFSILKGTFLAGDYSFESIHDELYPETGMNGTSESDSQKNIYTYTYLETIMAAAEYAQVSPYFLASRLRQEMGVSGTELSFGTYPGLEGYFNFFNIGAYAHSGRSARENGARYAKNNNETGSYLRPWTNPYRAILGGSDFLGSGYIRKEQNTLYLQKYDVTDGGNGLYDHQYMSNVNAPTSEASSMKKAYTNAGLGEDHIFSFNIPVFKNMPRFAAAAPCSDDIYASNNNWLSSISVSNATLSPAFSRTTYEYTVKVPSNVSSVTISAETLDENATVLEAGSVPLIGNKTEHIISVLAPSYELRTYKITIVKDDTVTSEPTATATSKPTATATSMPTATVTSKPTATATPTATVTPTQKPTPTPTPTPVPNPTITSNNYKLGTILTGVQPSTQVDAFLKNINIKNGSLQVMDKNGDSKGSGFISTGDKLQVYKGNSLYKAYPIVIFGDINCDGKITLKDMVHVQRLLLEIDNAEGTFLLAYDVNDDSKCTLIDMVMIQRHLLGIKSISQNR